MFQFAEVGGSVRDRFLGLNSKDVDFVVIPTQQFETADHAFNALVAHLKETGFKVFLETPQFFTIQAQVPDGNPLRERTNVAESSLRNTLAFAARQERPMVCSVIADLIHRIESLQTTDSLFFTLKFTMSTGKLILGGTAAALALLITAGQLTTISTGENGLYVGFDGQVKNEVLTPGIKYDGFGSIKVFNTRKITVTANDLRPKTKDNTIMKEMDATVTYSINPTSLYEFYTNYDLSNHAIGEGSQVQLMSSYISRLITSSVNQSVDEFPALEEEQRDT